MYNTFLFTLLIIWCIVWKGLALWKAGTRKEKVWFIVLFLVNTVGILEIVYLMTRKQVPIKKQRKRKK